MTATNTTQGVTMTNTTTYYRTNKGKRRHLNWTCANGRRSIHQGDVIEIPAAEVADWLACRFCCTADDAAKTPAHVRLAAAASPDECPNTGVDYPQRIIATCKDCGKKGSTLNGRLRKHRRADAPKVTAAAPVEVVEAPAAVEPVADSGIVAVEIKLSDGRVSIEHEAATPLTRKQMTTIENGATVEVIDRRTGDTFNATVTAAADPRRMWWQIDTHPVGTPAMRRMHVTRKEILAVNGLRMDEISPRVSADTQARLNSIIPAVDIAELNAKVVHDALPAHLTGEVSGNHYVKPAADNRVAPAPVESPAFMAQHTANTTTMTMTNVCKVIRRDGSAPLVLDGETIVVGFEGSGHPGIVTMLGGGYYTIRTGGKSIEIGKGQHVTVAAQRGAHVKQYTEKLNAGPFIDIEEIVLDDEADRFANHEEITISAVKLDTVRIGDIIIGIDGRRGGLHHTVTATLHSEHRNAIGFITPSGITGNLYADSLVSESVTVMRALPTKIRYRRIDRVAAAHVVAGDRLIVERDERFGWLPTRRVLAVIATATGDSRKDGNRGRIIPTDVGDIRVPGATFFGIADADAAPAAAAAHIVRAHISEALRGLPYGSARIIHPRRIADGSPEHTEMLRQGWVNPAGFLTMRGQSARSAVLGNWPLRFKI